MSGIDSCSGISFEEALLMCGTLSSKNSKRKKITNVDQDVKEVAHTLLKQHSLEPINMNRSSLTLTNRSILKNSPTRKIMSKLMMSRNQSAKVYSGNRTHRKVETLFNTCLQVLQDNVDALEYTGGVPYMILKPVLEQATANQLFKIEHYNPYLIESTDHMWKRHCEEDFRKKSRKNLELWRDMYIRCLEEREKKLNMISANRGRDKLFGVRLAYVDSVMKLSQNARKRRRRKKKRRKLGTYKISSISHHRYPECMM